MRQRALAPTSLMISEIGFGCGRLASIFQNSEALRTLLEAHDRGITFYDTADIYGQGRSEEMLGKAFKGKRHSTIIATKAGYQLSTVGSIGAKLRPVLRPIVKRLAWFRRSVQSAVSSQKQQNFSQEYLQRAIDQSLRRLQTDYIDIFLLHSPDPAVIESADWLPALERAKAQGKIRYYGISCLSIADSSACMKISGVSCVQVPVNLIEKDGLDSLIDAGSAGKIGVLARQPLASGLLAKPLAELRPMDFPWDRKEFDSKVAKLRASRDLSGCGGRTMAHAALRYALQLKGIGSIVLGMSSREHLRENLSLVHEACLTEVESDQITAIRSDSHLSQT